jgi:asparagine synthase (glutamine-hydrolysing)
MCGIAGAIVTSAPFPNLSHVLGAMRHRGPDDEGEFRDGGVWLGHRRLSIIDLSDAASQPMTCDRSGTIVFNGEIYDHAEHRVALEASGEIFRTRSDTEVLLRGLSTQGVRFLRGLHGMYALAWWNPRTRRLLLARDHCGMKPLYVWRAAGRLAFASEVRALGMLVAALKGATTLNPAALAEFLAWGSVPEPLTVLRDIEMIPADEVWEIDVDSPGSISTSRVARFAAEDVPAAGGVESVVEAVRTAVRRHVVSDQPVALFLSAGLDSGVLAAELAAAPGARRHAISVVLGSRGTADEPMLVARLAAKLGLPLHLVEARALDGRLPEIMAAYDQPSIDGINTFLIAEATKALGYRVALSGLGADEVFGGYAHLRPTARYRAQIALARIIRPLEPILASLPDLRMRRLAMLSSGQRLREPPQRSWRRIMTDTEIRRLMPGVTFTAPQPLPIDPLEIEQKTYLRDTLLRDTDVLGMAHGVEIRSPYLDPAVLRSASTIGSARLTSPDRPSKSILRDGWDGILDPLSLTRPKTGFTLNLAPWLARNDDVLRAALERARRSPLFDPAALNDWWSHSRRILRTRHPSAWVPSMMLLQISQQLERWGDA